MSDASSAPVMVDSEHQLLSRISPVNMSLLTNAGLSPDALTLVELGAGSELYELLTDYVVKRSAGVSSFGLAIGRAACGGDDDDCAATATRTVAPSLGLGLHAFTTDAGAQLYALLQTLGEPVGTDCGAAVMKNLVLISPRADDLESLRALAERLVADSDKVHPSKFTVWRWHIQYGRWMRGQVATARPLDSVVLPRATEEMLLADLGDFLSADTRRFYEAHGIPHKRSYLFHGTPGAGKTSAIQALAGRFGRNVCYLTAHPELTDDSLKSAIEHVPSKSLVVLEDVDALFDAKREKKPSNDKSLLTFSGLLNALDGVGGASGQIFILTTNHRERLDPALIRNGRVDLHVPFADAVPEQMRSVFGRFYPTAGDALATRFEAALTAALAAKPAAEGKTAAAEGKEAEGTAAAEGPARTVSMAALQSYFISMRTKGAEEAVASVGRIVEELDERAKNAPTAAAEGGAHKEGGKETGKEGGTVVPKDGEGKGGGEGKKEGEGKEGGGEMHIHVHVHKP